MLKRNFLIMLVVVAFVSFLTYTEAGAVANGDGTCSAIEAANYDCGQFGTNVIEYLGAGSSNSCPLWTQVNGVWTVTRYAPCTVYYYKYTGGTTNQVNVAIPLNVTQLFNNALDVNCSQYITDGTGDPTTGFGRGFYTFGICRMAPNMVTLPPPTSPPAPSGATFWIAADPSSVDKTVPLNWQVRQSKTELYNDSIVGPVTAPSPVSQTGATVMDAATGTSCTYSFQGGQIVFDPVACPTGRFVPVSKLCLPTSAGEPITFTNAQGNWTCQTISFMTDLTSIKTTGSDGCVRCGGGMFCF